MDGDGQAERRVGATLKGKYSLERLIGVGGMAAVYRGSHRNGNRVAVKVLHPALGSNADIRDRFLREGYVANKVDHRGAVRVLDDDVADDGAVFLVMELLEGETLNARWERSNKRLPQREVVELAHQLLDVLAAAHDKGIVHRDVKPENLFVTREGALKVLDFGIARLRDPLGGGHASATRTGRMLGTPAFMPPEQVLGRARSIDGQTDLWSVGATMFTLISGQYVHAAETVEELLVYAGSRPARPIGSVAPEVAPSIAAVIDQALAFEKSARWSDAQAMQAALEQAYAHTFRATIPGARSGVSIQPDAQLAQAATAYAPQSAISPRLAPTIDDVPAGLLRPPRVSPAAQTWQPTTQVAHARSASTTAGVVDPGPTTAGTSRRVLWTSVFGAVVLAALAGIGAVRVARVQTDHDSSNSPAVAASIGAPTVLVLSSPPPGDPVPASASASAASGAAFSLEAGTVPVNDLPHAPTAPLRYPPPPYSPPAAPAAPAAAKTGCSPPYTVDSAGRRIPKPECL